MTGHARVSDSTIRKGELSKKAPPKNYRLEMTPAPQWDRVYVTHIGMYHDEPSGWEYTIQMTRAQLQGALYILNIAQALHPELDMDGLGIRVAE